MAPADEDQGAELEHDEEPGRPLTRGVMIAGLVAAGALLACMYAGGAAPKIPGIGAVLGFITGFLLVLALFTGVMTAASWLLRYRRREMGAWSLKHGQRAAHWGYRHSRRHGGRLGRWLAAWGAARWQAWRQRQPRDEDQADELEDDTDRWYGTGPESVPAPAPPAAPVAEDPAPIPAQEEPSMSTPAQAPAAATSATTRTSGRKVPAVMRAVIAWIDDFEPENDADLHDFLQSLAAGLHDVGASLNDLYELCTSPGVRIGRGGMSATHDAADSIAEASAGVSKASKALANYYGGVSDEVAGGVELPKDGNFITGET
jgi:hypothetical protein